MHKNVYKIICHCKEQCPIVLSNLIARVPTKMVQVHLGHSLTNAENYCSGVCCILRSGHFFLLQARFV